MSVKDLTSYKEYLGYIQEHVKGAISSFRDNYKGQKVEYKIHLSHALSLAIDAKKQIETIISKKRARLPSFFSDKPDGQAIQCRFEELQRLDENLQNSLQEEVSATEYNPPSSRPS